MPKLFEMDFSVALKGVEGYCWEFPFVSSKDNKTYIKYGIMDKLGSVSTEQLKTLLYEYMKEKAIDEKPKTEGYPERYFTKMPKFIFKRAVLVGDANGVDPWLGEGLAVAFEQAEYASNIIANAFKSKANLATWKNYLFPLSFYGRNHCVLNIIANRVYGSHRKFWIKQITQNKKLAKLTYQKSFKGYGRFFKSLWRVFFLGRHYLQK